MGYHFVVSLQLLYSIENQPIKQQRLNEYFLNTKLCVEYVDNQQFKKRGFSLKKNKCKSEENPGTPKDLELKEMGSPGSVPTCFCQKATCRQWDSISRPKGSAVNKPPTVPLNQKQLQSCYEAQIFDFKNYITVYNLI